VTPYEWNRAIAEGRMLSRNAGSAIVKPLGEQTATTIEAKIAEIKARARADVFAACKEAEQKIVAALENKRAK